MQHQRFPKEGSSQECEHDLQTDRHREQIQAYYILTFYILCDTESYCLCNSMEGIGMNLQTGKNFCVLKSGIKVFPRRTTAICTENKNFSLHLILDHVWDKTIWMYSSLTVFTWTKKKKKKSRSKLK